MDKFGVLSLLVVLLSVLLTFIFIGPNANVLLLVIILGSLSILGIFFAVISKKWLSRGIGVLCNAAVLVFTYFLFLGYNIVE